MAAMMLILASCMTKKPQPPVAQKNPYVIKNNGNERIDEYFWMRLTDEQKNAESPDSQTVQVLTYLNAENDYAKAIMKHTEPFQEKLFEEIKGRIKEDDETVPYLENGYYYQTKYFQGKEYAVHYRWKEGSAEPGVLLDVNTLAEGHKYTGVGGLSVSPDNNLLAYGSDHVSRRQYTIFVRDLTTGALLSDTLANTSGQVEWGADNKSIFYVVKDPSPTKRIPILVNKTSGSTTIFEMIFPGI